MSAAQNRLARLEKIADLLTKHPTYDVVRWICKNYKVQAGAARKYANDAKCLIQSRYHPEELERLKGVIADTLAQALAASTNPKDKAACARILNQMFGFNAPVQYEVKTPPLYDGPGIPELNASSDSD